MSSTDSIPPAGRPRRLAPAAPLPRDMARALTIPRHRDGLPARATGWRDVTVRVAVPALARRAADDVRHLLHEPELHYASGLRLGTLALLPRPGALTRVVLSWEWSVEAASFAVHSLDGNAYAAPEAAALESWLRVAARRLDALDDVLDRAAAHVVADVAAGLDVSTPSLARTAPGGDGDGTVPHGRDDRVHDAELDLVVVEARLGTSVEPPRPGAAHARVEVVVPDGADPGWEAFVDASTRETLGFRRTLDEDGTPVAFSYLVADHVDDVDVADLVHWHDQHILGQLLAEDVRQACVHLLSGLESPASVGYAL